MGRPQAQVVRPSPNRQRLKIKSVARITVSEVGEDVIACLEAQAKANQRSLESEIRAILLQHTRRDRVVIFRERTAQLCSLTAGHRTDSVALLREDRSR